MFGVSSQLPVRAQSCCRSAWAYTVLSALVCGALVAVPVHRAHAQDAQAPAAAPAAQPGYPVPPPQQAAPGQPQYVPPPPPPQAAPQAGQAPGYYPPPGQHPGYYPPPQQGYYPPPQQYYPPMRTLTAMEIEQLKQLAKQDADSDISGFGWFSLGCLIGAVGIILGYALSPSPPGSRLIGKSPEFVSEYSRYYKSYARSKRGRNAIAGLVVGCVVGGVVYLGVYAATLGAVFSKMPVQ
ncbi:MAG: hypothetical protein ACOX6T_02515 [Myxococcales bacterium]|jgi:hypothetical protein